MIEDKTILVTGGTGSLGQAFVEEALKQNPRTIRIFSRNEFQQWEMKQHFNNSILRYLIGDVRDRGRLRRALEGVDLVVHTAALKHVAFCEYNPIEAIRTNIDGTVNVIDASIDCGVSKVLGISSDKAVDPINLYGATKLVQEKLMLHANVYGDTQFSCVRFGNFWGSRGSVIPTWQKQAEKGEIIITDPDMSRYWITLTNAAKFAIICFERMEGGEIFIPKMEKWTVKELAEKIAPGVPHKKIGKQLGEKTHEYLISEQEDRLCQAHTDCWVIKPQPDRTYTISIQSQY